MQVSQQKNSQQKNFKLFNTDRRCMEVYWILLLQIKAKYTCNSLLLRLIYSGPSLSGHPL